MTRTYAATTLATLAVLILLWCMLAGGGAIATEEPRVEVQRTYRFVHHLQDAEITAAKPEHVRVRHVGFEVAGELRTVLAQHPVSEVRFAGIAIGESARLRFGIGVNQLVWEERGDGVGFEIVVESDAPESAPATVFSAYVDPKNEEGDRRWFDEELDLSAFGGQTIDITFRTDGGPRGNTAADWAGWSEPELPYRRDIPLERYDQLQSSPSDGFDVTSEPVLQRPNASTPTLDLTFPSTNPERIPLRTVRAFPHVELRQPVFLTAPPDGSDRIFVLEKAGRILVFPRNDEVRSADVFLDIRDRVESTGESGVLGLAFDPDYARSGRLYVYYTLPDPRRGILAAYTVDPDDPNRADPASEVVLLSVEKTSDIHCGGMLQFGPDGMLYVSIGDGETDPEEYDENRRAQDLSSLLGKILRIDPSGGEPYAIPEDNPFVGRDDGARGEVWAYGLRNPWRFSIDPKTERLWVGDVGRDVAEEVNVVPRGGNMGWSAFEGTHPYDEDKAAGAQDSVPPLLEISRPLSRSGVIGGYVYHGDALPSLRGAYLYGDHMVPKVWALRYDGERVVSHREVAAVDQVSSFGLDQHGELYAVSLDGEIYRFEENERGDASWSFPERLSETGLFADTASFVPAAGLLSYAVIAPFWSDGALKRRWVALPEGAQVDFHADEPWSFPVGTVFVKHFDMAMTVDDPASLRRLETRVMVHEETGWAGYTYRWNEEQTDAFLLTGPESEELSIVDPTEPEGVRRQRYDYPSAIDCMRCHTDAAGFVLGARTNQLNFEALYRDGRDNQLDAWNALGLFGDDIGDASAFEVLANPADESQPLERRARSYLATNCSPCHQPGGPPRTDMDLRFATATEETKLFGVPAQLPGPEGTFLVRAGDRKQSVLWMRMQNQTTLRMPPLSTNRVNPEVHRLIGRWIDAAE